MPASCPSAPCSYRTDPEYWRKWYPADWITRVLPGPVPQLVLQPAGDGHGGRSAARPSCRTSATPRCWPKMAARCTRAGATAIEFNEAADKMGVDVMRWLYCAHKPENDLLFGYHRGDEVRRQFLHPAVERLQLLRHLCQPGWLGAGQASFDPAYPEGPHPAQRQPARPLGAGPPEPGGGTV